MVSTNAFLGINQCAFWYQPPWRLVSTLCFLVSTTLFLVSTNLARGGGGTQPQQKVYGQPALNPAIFHCKIQDIKPQLDFWYARTITNLGLSHEVECSPGFSRSPQSALSTVFVLSGAGGQHLKALGRSRAPQGCPRDVSRGPSTPRRARRPRRNAQEGPRGVQDSQRALQDISMAPRRLKRSPWTPQEGSKRTPKKATRSKHNRSPGSCFEKC